MRRPSEGLADAPAPIASGRMRRWWRASSGWPGRSRVASFASGRASTRKTSFARLSLLKITGGVNSACGAMYVTFAAIGAAYALAQFLLYSQIAASKRAAIAVLWIATAALVILVWLFHSSVLQIALVVLCVACALALIGVVELLIERSRESKGLAHA